MQDAGVRSQVSGIRCQGSGVRSKNEDHLISAFCFLPTAFEGGQMEKALAVMATLDKMSPPTGKERTSNFKK